MSLIINNVAYSEAKEREEGRRCQGCLQTERQSQDCQRVRRTCVRTKLKIGINQGRFRD